MSNKTMTKSEAKQAENIAKTYDFLVEAHRKTKDGYVAVSLTKIAKNAGLHRSSMYLKAVVNLDIIKKRGNLRSTMWHWYTDDLPGQKMAERTLREVRRLEANDREAKKANEKVKGRNLVPILSANYTVTNKTIQENMSNQEYILEKLNKLYDEDCLFKLADKSIAYQVDLSAFFGGLIAMGVIEEYKTDRGMYNWVGEAPNKTMAELICQEYAEQKVKKPAPSKSKGGKSWRPKSVTPRTRQKVLDFLHHVYQDGKCVYHGSLTPIIKDKLGLNDAFLTIARKEGFLVDEGDTKNPVYRITDVPENIIQRIIDVHTGADKQPKPTYKFDNDVDPPETMLGTKPDKKSDGPALDLAERKRKVDARIAELQEELAKLTKVRDAIDLIESTTFA